MKFKKSILILSLIVLLGTALRLLAVSNTQSLWFDEVVSVKIAKQGIISSWDYLRWENNPPLHYLFLHSWIKIFGEKEKILRLSSVFWSLLNILAIYLLGRKLFDRKTGLLSAFIFAISAYQIYLARDARMYQMLIFFCLLSFYYFWQLMQENKKSHWYGYIIFTILALYTHLTAVFVLLVQNIYWLVYKKNNKIKTRNWAWAEIAIAAAFMPWLINFSLRSLSTINSGAWYLNTQRQGFIFLQIPYAFLFIGQKFPWIEPLSLLLIITLLLASLIRVNYSRQKKDAIELQANLTPAKILVLLMFLAPLIVNVIFNIWVAKYYLVAAIGLYLLIASGINNFTKMKTKIMLAVILLMLTLPYTESLNKNSLQHKWRQVAEYIKTIEKPNDKIMLTAFVYRLPFEYYYRGKTQVLGFEPKNLKGNLLSKAVKYNWYPILTKDNMPDQGVLLAGAHRVLVIDPSVVSLVHNSNIPLDWFVRNNWKLVRKKQFGGFIRPTVLVFENPKLN